MKAIQDIIADTCRNCGCPDLTERIGWQFKSIGVCLGKARYYRPIKSGVFYLSEDLWPKTTEQDKIQVIVHEICHLTAYHNFSTRRIKPHGPEWKLMMQLNGLKPTRCHSLDVSDIRQKRKQQEKFEVYCNCNIPHKVTKIVLVRMQKQFYKCKRCNSIIRKVK